tara:strand:+ start:35738 stop:36484 length:747 start_codon:yes stop_codon:yes gene_type:complete
MNMKNNIKKFMPKFLLILRVKIITIFGILFYKLKLKKLIIRPNTTDLKVFKSIFVFNELKLPVKLNPKLIIDGGAYIGYSALYYHLKYPSSTIICIEPEASNFNILKKHISNHSNIMAINAGLWHKNTYLKIKDNGIGEWGFSVEEVSKSVEFDIEAITIDKILEKSGKDNIDILKLDIEGAEKQLFSSNYELWLKKTNVIVIELHDRFIEGCSEALYSAIKKDEWLEFKEGEKVILIRKKFINNLNL